MITFKFPKLDYKFLFIWLILIGAGAAYLSSVITREPFWHEEAYTAMVIKHHFRDIWHTAGSAGHTPLYFIMLKLFTLIFGYSEFTMRFFSVLGILFLAAVGAGPVKRVLGNKVAHIYTFIVIVTPINLSLAREAKMYSWAMFFTLGTFLYGYLAASFGKKSDWVLYALFTLGCLYTYSFSILPLLIMNYIMLRWILSKNRSVIKYYLVAITPVALLFIPWVILYSGDMINTFSSFRDFGYPPDGLQTLWKALLTPFRHKFGIDLMIEIPMLLAVGFLIAWALFQSFLHRKKETALYVSTLLVYSLTLTLGAFVTYTILPVFLERISIAVVGVFLLALSYAVSLLNYRHNIFVACALFFLAALPQNIYIFTNDLTKPVIEVRQYINDNIGPEDAFIHFTHDTFTLFSYYYPNHKNIIYSDIKPLKTRGYYETFSQGITASWQNIKTLSEDNINLWLINHPNDPNYSTQVSLVSLGILDGIDKTKRIYSQFPFYDFTVRKAAVGNGSFNTSTLRGNVKIKLKALGSEKGRVVVKLFSEDGPFLYGKKINEGNVFATESSEIKNLASEVVFKNVPYGTYAAFAYHDQNDNQKLDFKENDFFKEGFGMTNGFGRGWLFFTPGIFFVESEETEQEINFINIY